MPINEIEELKDCFVKQLLPNRIYLFGSYADNTYTENSDFDFYIVVSDGVTDLAAETTKAYKAVRHVKKRPVDIIVGTRSRFESRKQIPSVENDVYQKGVLLYDTVTQEIKEWCEMAAVDLGVAKHLFDTYHPKPLEIICYHCQQSAEKSIKAVILSYGAPGGMPKSHDVSFLLNQIKNLVQIDERLYDYADTLAPYGVSVRYPNELFLEERHAKEAIQYAEAILQWAKMIIEINPVI